MEPLFILFKMKHLFGQSFPGFVSFRNVYDILDPEAISMKLEEWLVSGDPVIRKLTQRYLFDQDVADTNSGYIQRYLDLFDQNTGRWGKAVYSPKWISTHYTMMELKYMEIPQGNPAYNQGIKTLLYAMWHPDKRPEQDMCVSAMMLGMAAYANYKDERMNEMVDYILAHRFPDGGWNCNWNSLTRPASKSSLHTTISVLEAFRDYLKNGYGYRRQEVASSVPFAEDFILRKHMFRSERTGAVINDAFTKCHYPERWHYDLFRGLEYFQSVQKPYDDRMSEALDIVENRFKRSGYLTKGPSYAGRLHFILEPGKSGRFTTLKALKILKYYRSDSFKAIINGEIGDGK